MTKARDTANIVGGGFSGTIAGATMEPTGDTAAGDNAAIGFTAAEGLILTGQGSTGDVTIKNDADALVAHVPTGTTGVTFAGTPTFPDGSIAVADLDIDGGTDINAALVDADLMIVDDGAGGTNRKATMARLATYMGTKIGGGLEFISSTDVSNAATASFTGFDSSKYDSYVFTLGNILPQTDNQLLQALLSVDDGSNYLSASDSYVKAADQSAGAGDGAFLALAYRGIGNATNEGFSGEYSLICPHLNTTTYFIGFGHYTRPDGQVEGHMGGDYALGKTKAATIVDGIQFKFASGNIVSGTITMYGRVNS